MADKIKHPKKKRRPVKKPPAISVFDTVVTREQWESWLKNQLRRESVILRKASVKTAATKDELENLMRKDAFLIAAAKALGVSDTTDHDPRLIFTRFKMNFIDDKGTRIVKEEKLRLFLRLEPGKLIIKSGSVVFRKIMLNQSGFSNLSCANY